MREGASSERRIKLGDKRCELFILIRPKKQNIPHVSHYNPMGQFDQNTVPNYNSMHPNKFQAPHHNNFQSFPNTNNNNINPLPDRNPRNHLFDNLKHMNMSQFNNNGGDMVPNNMMGNPNMNNNFQNKPPGNFSMRPMPNGPNPNDFFQGPQQQQQQYPPNNQSIDFNKVFSNYFIRFLQ